LQNGDDVERVTDRDTLFKVIASKAEPPDSVFEVALPEF
jgi:hypothetical protein